tara:strand:- start:507 stop:1232 length:726 start_codon:yes stop_codon:yes gene_type:complete
VLLSETVEHRRRFAPGWPLWVFTLSLLPLLLGLGTWQLQRAEQKQQLQADIDALAQAPAKTLAQLGTQPPADWQPLSLQGQLDPQHIWLLDNRTRNGQAGVEVLQAFQADNGDWLVLNRGWLPWPDRRQPPDISTPPGRLQLQAEKLPASSAGWRPGRRACDADQRSCVVAQLDLDALRAQSALPLLNWSARLTNIGSAALTLDWPALPMSASRHTGYAVQWFSLAAALLALFLWAGFRPQ